MSLGTRSIEPGFTRRQAQPRLRAARRLVGRACVCLFRTLGTLRADGRHSRSSEVTDMPTWALVLIVVLLVLAVFGGFGYYRR